MWESPSCYHELALCFSRKFVFITFMDRRLTGITLYAFQTLKDLFTDFRFEFNEACHGVRLLGHTTHVWPDIWFCHYEGLLQHHFNIIWHSDFIQYSNSRVFNRRLHFSFVVAVTENEAAMNFMKSLPRLPFLILRIENLWSEQKESKLWTFPLYFKSFCSFSPLRRFFLVRFWPSKLFRRYFLYHLNFFCVEPPERDKRKSFLSQILRLLIRFSVVRSVVLTPRSFLCLRLYDWTESTNYETFWYNASKAGRFRRLFD